SVYNQAAFIYDDSFPISRYIELAGGMDKNAADDEVYILKADGTAVSKKSINRSWLRWDRDNKGWVSGGVGSYALDPGDTIVVPEKLEKTAWLKEFKDITQILYQIAVTAGVIIVAF
ncbi:MAG TPA: polysaccharide biosynthesis protein, partial [Thermodesulfobacteriota bacterium]